MEEPNYTKRELDLMHKELSNQIESGFQGVYARQDITNGKVIKHEEEIKNLKQIHSDELQEEVDLFKKWKHHIVWFGLLIGWTLLQTTGLVNIANPF